MGEIRNFRAAFADAMRMTMTIGSPRRQSPVKPVLGVSLIAGLMAGGLYLYRHRDRVELIPRFASARAPARSEPLPTAPAAAPLPIAADAAPSSEQLRRRSGVRLATMALNGPLETEFVRSAGAVGPALAQVATRALVWWVAVPHELLRGDKLQVLFEERPSEEPVVHALRFESQKTGKTHTAYRFQPADQPFARYYLPDGHELEERLDGSPLDDYEQVTSLLRDGRRHQGVDFKVAVGTPVKAPFDAVVVRKNWNTRSNGNCLELREVGGDRRAMMLHLDVFPRELKPGQRVRKGEVVAHSGNSGRSFAPHLHYQLMRRDDRVIDPFSSFRTYRRQLASDRMPQLQAEIARLDALMIAP